MQWQKRGFTDARKLREDIGWVKTGSYDLRILKLHKVARFHEYKNRLTFTTFPSSRTLLERVQNFNRKEQEISPSSNGVKMECPRRARGHSSYHAVARDGVELLFV